MSEVVRQEKSPTQEEGLELAKLDEVEDFDDRPDDATLFVLANDAATEVVNAMMVAVSQRMDGFRTAARYLEDSADDINADKNTVLAFVEKAFSVVTASLLGVGLAGMAATGAVGILKGLILGTLTIGKDAVAAKVGEAAEGDEVDWSVFAGSIEELISQQSLLVAQTWKAAELRARFLAAPYPHLVAPAAVTGAEAMRDSAFRLQFASTITSWAGKVNEVKGGDSGVLIFDVAFDPSGSYAAECEVAGMGRDFASLLRGEHNVDSKQQAPSLCAKPSLRPVAGSRSSCATRVRRLSPGTRTNERSRRLTPSSCITASVRGAPQR